MSSGARERAIKVAIALLILTAALAVRLHNINQPLVKFHATRHYRSALIARDFYYHAAAGVPEQAVRVADANLAMQPAGEPPLLEWLACGSYLALGRENVAIPRAFAAIAWVAGAIPLFLLALRAGSVNGAIVAAVLYLFLPYGIVASRNFQPDALMTLAALWALVAVVRHHERPDPGRLATAIVLIGVATVVKPMSIFLTLPVLIGLHLARPHARRLSAHAGIVVALTLCLLPAALYYGYGAVFGTFAKDQMRMRFVPHLLTTAFYWSGVLTQIGRVFTVPLFLTSVLAIALAPRAAGRVILASLWIGYAVFAVAFTYHMATHDYYHWPFIAAVAIGVGAVVSRVEGAFVGRLSPRAAAGLTAAVSIAIAALGTWQAWPRLTVPSADVLVARYRAIGTLAEHETRVLFLDDAYGYPLMYHSELSGDAWPNQDDLSAEALDNEEPLDAKSRFARDYADFAPRFFVVTDMASLEAQPDLRALLAERAVVVRQAPDYHVYKFVEKP